MKLDLSWHLFFYCSDGWEGQDRGRKSLSACVSGSVLASVTLCACHTFQGQRAAMGSHKIPPWGSPSTPGHHTQHLIQLQADPTMSTWKDSALATEGKHFPTLHFLYSVKITPRDFILLWVIAGQLLPKRDLPDIIHTRINKTNPLTWS